MRPALNLAVRVLLVAALWPCLARADVIHYKDGRTLQGKITARTETELTVRTDFGTVVVPMAKVASIEEKLTPAEELASRRAALPAGDANGLYELALWARDAQLLSESRALLREVVALAPDHAPANQALGRMKVDDRWLEPADVAAYVKLHEAEKHAEGLAWDEGSWLPEAEVMARRGFVLVHDAWVPRRQGETTLLLEALAGLSIPVKATSGEFITLYSDLPVDTAGALVADLDDIVRDLLLRWPPTGDERKALPGGDIPVLLLPDLDAVGRLLDSEVLTPYGASKSWRERWRTARGFTLSSPRPFIGLVGHGEHLARSGDEDRGRLGCLAHQLGHVLVQRFKCGARTPGWVENGMAAFYEAAVTQHGTLTITSMGRDPGNEDPEVFEQGWETFALWHENLQRPGMMADLGALSAFMSRRAGDMNSREIGVSWSVLRFLLEKHPDELLAYVRAFDTGAASVGKLAPALHEEAWLTAFAEDQADIEREWVTWLAQQPASLLPPPLLSRTH